MKTIAAGIAQPLLQYQHLFKQDQGLVAYGAYCIRYRGFVINCRAGIDQCHVPELYNKQFKSIRSAKLAIGVRLSPICAVNVWD